MHFADTCAAPALGESDNPLSVGTITSTSSTAARVLRCQAASTNDENLFAQSYPRRVKHLVECPSRT